MLRLTLRILKKTAPHLVISSEETRKRFAVEKSEKLPSSRAARANPHEVCKHENASVRFIVISSGAANGGAVEKSDLTQKVSDLSTPRDSRAPVEVTVTEHAYMRGG